MKKTPEDKLPAPFGTLDEAVPDADEPWEEENGGRTIAMGAPSFDDVPSPLGFPPPAKAAPRPAIPRGVAAPAPTPARTPAMAPMRAPAPAIPRAAAPHVSPLASTSLAVTPESVSSHPSATQVVIGGGAHAEDATLAVAPGALPARLAHDPASAGIPSPGTLPTGTGVSGIGAALAETLATHPSASSVPPRSQHASPLAAPPPYANPWASQTPQPPAHPPSGGFAVAPPYQASNPMHAMGPNPPMASHVPMPPQQQWVAPPVAPQNVRPLEGVPARSKSETILLVIVGVLCVAIFICGLIIFIKFRM